MAGDVKDGTVGFHLMDEASIILTSVPIVERFIALRYLTTYALQ